MTSALEFHARAVLELTLFRQQVFCSAPDWESVCEDYAQALRWQGLYVDPELLYQAALNASRKERAN
jgi:hypothetical protein